MKPVERVLSTLNRAGYDRIPLKHQATPEINDLLFRHFGVPAYEDLLLAVGDDFRHVEPRYVGPELNSFPDGSWEGLYRERYRNISFGHGAYPEAVYLPFADVESPARLRDRPFPDADQFDYSDIPAQCERFGDYAVVYGNAGVLDFMNGIARCRGVERVLLDVGETNPVFLELVERRFEFEYERAKRVLKAAGGKVLILYCGEDLGCQLGPVISPAAFERIFAERYRLFFELGHRFGARNMMHSCGSVRAFIPRLIELGLDILDVVQVAAAGMEIEGLRRDFGRDLAFCGTMCVQSTLLRGGPDDVRREVRRRLDLFPDGGLILGPSHAIQVGTRLDNVLAMYEYPKTAAREEGD